MKARVIVCPECGIHQPATGDDANIETEDGKLSVTCIECLKRMANGLEKEIEIRKEEPMDDKPKPMSLVVITIPIYRENIEYGLEMNDIDVTEENIKKGANIAVKGIKEQYHDDESLFGDNEAASIIEDNIDKF